MTYASDKVMNQDVSSFVERYQLIYEKDPTSKVFAPLAEAYRRMGLIDEAIDLAQRGVKRHPHFASGRVALGKCFVQKREFERAISELQAAVELSPENLLAHQLMADCFMKLKKPTEALAAFKMVLFLNPHDAKVSQAVKKLESDIYADSKITNWVEEDFSMEKLSDVATKANEVGLKDAPQASEPARSHFERELALLDARMSRGDWVVVRKNLEALLLEFPNNGELLSRKQRIDDLSQTTFDMGEWISPIQSNSKAQKIQKLNDLLAAIEKRRKA